MAMADSVHVLPPSRLLHGGANSSFPLVKKHSKWHYIHWIGRKHSTELPILDVHLEALMNMGHAQILVGKASFCTIASALAVDMTSIWL